jgi:hypothetical protein
MKWYDYAILSIQVSMVCIILVAYGLLIYNHFPKIKKYKR